MKWNEESDAGSKMYPKWINYQPNHLNERTNQRTNEPTNEWLLFSLLFAIRIACSVCTTIKLNNQGKSVSKPLCSQMTKVICTCDNSLLNRIDVCQPLTLSLSLLPKFQQSFNLIFDIFTQLMMSHFKRCYNKSTLLNELKMVFSVE